MPVLSVSPCCQATSISLHLPGAARDDARLSRRAISICRSRCPSPELVRPLLDLVDAEPPRHFVEEDVAGHLDAALQIDMAVAAVSPAAWKMWLPNCSEPVQFDAEIGVNNPVIHGRQRHRGLEGRARRIDARDRLVDQRLVVVRRSVAFHCGVRDADIELVGIDSPAWRPARAHRRWSRPSPRRRRFRCPAAARRNAAVRCRW